MARRFPLKVIPAGPAREPAEILAEVKRLYFKTTRATIEADFDRAIDLLKSLPTVEDRQRAHVYMEGLAEMRKEWQRGRPRSRRATSRS
jgi:hypothetical protein